MDNAFKDLDDWLSNSEMPNGKRKVVKAALTLFSKQGYDGTSTAEIAQESGMSQATIFKYFKSKDDLLLFIIEPMVEHILPTYGKDFAMEVQAQQGNLEQIVNFIVTNRYHFLVQNKDAAIIMISQVIINEKIRNMLLNRIAKLKNKFLDRIWEYMQATGELRDDVHFVDVVRLIVGQLVFYFFQSQRIVQTSDEKAIEDDLSRIVKLILRAIKK